MDVVQVTFYVGMALGAALILSVCWVYQKKRSAGAGEIAFCAFGVVLVGLSIWSRVRIEAQGMVIELQRLAQRQEQLEVAVKETATAVAATSRTIGEVNSLAARAPIEPLSPDLGRLFDQQEIAVDRMNLSARALTERRAPPP